MLPGFLSHPGEQPSRDLPVTAQPTMFAAVVGTVVGRIILNHLDIAYQSGPCVCAFDQIVTQQRISRESLFEDAINGIYFIDSFASEDALAKQILIGV